MSRYTTELRYICESKARQKGVEYYDRLGARELIKVARPEIFDFDYPIFDEDYRPTLETNIIRHYYTREIAAETVGLWELWLENKMNEIMPAYNAIYRTMLLDFNPLYTVNYYVKKDDTNKTDTDRSIVTAQTDATTLTSNNEKDRSSVSDERLDKDKFSHEKMVDALDKTVTDHEDTRETIDSTDTVHQDTSSKTDNTLDDTEFTTGTSHNDRTYNETKITDGQTTDAFSDTPQGALTNVMAENYLTTADKKNNDETVVTNGTQTDDGTTSGTLTGNHVTDGLVVGVADTTDVYHAEDVGVLDGVHVTDLDDVKDTDGHEKTRSWDSVKLKERQNDKKDQLNNLDRSIDVKDGKNVIGIDDYLEHVYGKQGHRSYAELLLEYRKLFMNVDEMIINDLSDLFMNIWK
ncbi:MAG: hypothetical protein LUD47_00800 [Clostridia bacterium]|nr:hypothetical protein [Clostridia bacterium]